MLRIGSHTVANNLVLAPMAGVSDSVHRRLCTRYGAGLAPTEMVASDTALWSTDKTASRFISDDNTPHSIQIVGYDADMMAQAAAQAALNADIIDINMGCPAKKVCSKAAGSALMRDEQRVADILTKVVASVTIPVTLKIRTGWDQHNKNAVNIARMAEAIGIQALTVHGRTRACRFNGSAEYDTIAEVKAAVSIPVIANGDITDAAKAKQVLSYTNADAIMVGRASQGNPFIFREIAHYLATGSHCNKASRDEVGTVAQEHLRGIHALYGEQRGYRIARKHIGWYFTGAKHAAFIKSFHQLTSAKAQQYALAHYCSNHFCSPKPSIKEVAA